MKTAITITNTIQIGMDEYKDVKKTKVFEDTATLLEIKQWIHRTHASKCDVGEISLATANFSDVIQ